MEADTIILATGQRVDLSFLGEHFGGQLKSARGLIDADTESFKTKKDGVYAGGDAVTGPDIAIRAILAGRVAAAGMNRDLGGCGECGCEKADCEEIGRENPSADGNPQEAAFLRFDPGAVENAESHKLKEIPVSERTLIKEDASSFDRETAMAEAGRCMNCGCYAVSPSDISRCW